MQEKKATIVFDLCLMYAGRILANPEGGLGHSAQSRRFITFLTGMRSFVFLVCSPFHMNVRYLFNVRQHKEALMKIHD